MDRALCAAYYRSANLTVGLALLNYLIQMCTEDGPGALRGRSKTEGMDDFLTIIANDYFKDSPQIVLLYDESWDISEMIVKLTVNTNKAFVSYFLPVDPEIGKRIRTQPADHFTHKLLPKANAFLVFVNDETGFENILQRMNGYPWWNKRARVLVMIKSNSLLPTKGILALMEDEKIFNGVVVTELDAKDNTTVSKSQRDNENATQQFLLKSVDLQVVALDPYPVAGHEKESYVGRWANGELQTMRPIFQEKIDNLRQHTLQVCVFEFPPLVIRKEIGPNQYEYSGLEVELLKQLATQLNFTYNFFEPPEGERWGTDLGNNTWTGLIGETQRHADFGFASVFLLDNREKAVDVSTPYDQDQGCFAVPRPEALQHWLGLVLPFSWKVWACVIAMAIVAGPTFSLITRPLGMDRSLSVGRGILYALGSLVSAQKAPHAKSHALRSFIVSWLIFCWLACILYRVALIVSLTVGPSAFKIESLRQLARSGLEWGGYQEVLKAFSNTTDSVDEDLFERFVEVTNSSEALERVAKEGDFALLDSGKFLRYAEKGIYFNGYSSEIHVSKECPVRYNVGLIMPIGSPFLEKTNELIMRLQNAGIIEKWYEDIIHLAAVSNKNRGRTYKGSHDKGLDIGDLKLCFVMILCGHFMAFLVLCLEHVHLWYQSGKAGEIGSSIIRKVSTVSGLSTLSTLSKCQSSGNPSVVITYADYNSPETCRSDSLKSLPLEMEQGWCNNCNDEEMGPNAVAATLGDIKALSCPHFKQFGEE